MTSQSVPLCFIDTETTGLHHDRQPWSAVGVTTPELERHTALGDARAVMRAYDAVMAGGAA